MTDQYYCPGCEFTRFSHNHDCPFNKPLVRHEVHPLESNGTYYGEINAESAKAVINDEPTEDIFKTDLEAAANELKKVAVQPDKDGSYWFTNYDNLTDPTVSPDTIKPVIGQYANYLDTGIWSLRGGRMVPPADLTISQLKDYLRCFGGAVYLDENNELTWMPEAE